MVVIKKSVLSDELPKEWIHQVKNGQKLDVVEFRNLQNFKAYMKNEVVPKPNGAASKRPIPYEKALDDLVKGIPVMATKGYDLIKQEVQSVLYKRGLLSETVYEGYEYDVEGDIVDIAKYLEGNPECMLKPKKAYDNHFYELYVSMAYLSDVRDKDVMKGLAQLLATVQLLEKEHIYIKITVVACSSDLIYGKNTQIILLPLFSYKDEKTIEEMASVLNDRFFRTYCFAIKEHIYKDELYDGYGVTIDLAKTIIPHKVDVVKLAEEIIAKTITPGRR